MRAFFTDTVGKQKTENKYTLCLVWEEQSTPKLIIRIFGHSGSCYCGCMNDHSMKIKVFEFVKRTKNLNEEDSLQQKAYYDKKYYSKVTNIKKRNSRLQRYNNALKEGLLAFVKIEKIAITRNSIQQGPMYNLSEPISKHK